MIHTAIRNGYGLIEALECQPNAINDLDETGQTPLRLSCVYERFEDMMYLIENGADPNTKDFEGLSPLHVAASNSLEPYVHALVDAGSDLNSRDSYDCTPLFLCLGNEAPHIAVTKYLLENGASVHSLNKLGDSIFHRMSIYAKGRLNTEQIFSQLMGAGANSVIDVADCDGNVPVNIAIMYNNVCMIRLLLSAGARIDIPNNNGNNVLHQAAHLGTLDTLQTLRDAQIEGIDIRATNNYGFTPIKSFWHSVNVESPGSSFRVPSEEETKAFEELMRDIRDRGILNECASLEALVTRLRDGCASEAQESLEDLSGKKRRAKIYEEAETFRAIALDIRRGDIELAIESLEEFMTVSKERMKLSPFEEEPDPWASNSDDESTDEPIDDDHSDGSDYQSDKGVVSDDE